MFQRSNGNDRNNRKENPIKRNIPRIKYRGVYSNEDNKESRETDEESFQRVYNWRDQVSREAAKINFSQPKKLRLGERSLRVIRRRRRLRNFCVFSRSSMNIQIASGYPESLLSPRRFVWPNFPRHRYSVAANAADRFADDCICIHRHLRLQEQTPAAENIFTTGTR